MFRKLFIIFLLFALSEAHLLSQKVGLVLSGGGAKGIAHIGLIQALEENNIPIDYITGTSMGAIVGALYSMGYTPAEMLQVIKSEDFRLWQSGTIRKEDEFYFKKNDPIPEILQFNIDFKGDSIKPQTYFLPSSLINPVQMNLAFLGLCSQSDAIANYDFSNLFVPFRCVGADVYNKQPIVFRNGDLGQAVRASMTFPLVFKPIEIDNMLIYDGGIYNNFPTDIMKQDFSPDFIIGSSVTDNPSKPKDRDIMGQLENMIMQKTDYTINPEEGIYIRSKLSQYGILDFGSADDIYNVGYQNGLQYIDSIRKVVHRNMPVDNINLQRRIYKSKLPDLVFRNVTVEGVSYPQQQYILSQIGRRNDNTFTFESFQRDYFSMLSEGKILEIIPTALYNNDSRLFELNLKVKMRENLSVGIGGLISSMSSNQAYLGVSYRSLSFFSMDYGAKMHIGRTYNSFEASARILFPSKVPFYVKLMGVYSNNKFFEDEKLLFDSEVQAYVQKRESFIKLRFGMPYRRTSKLELSTAYGAMKDRYTQPDVNGFTRSYYDIWNSTLRVEQNTLNSPMYPNDGSHFSLLAQYAFDWERYDPSETYYEPIKEVSHNWFQLSINWEKYNKLSRLVTLGYKTAVLYTNKPTYNNFSSTIIQMPSFTPTPHSKVVFNESLRAPSFAALGAIPIVNLSRSLSIRSEYYGFLPIISITKGENREVKRTKDLKKINHFGELSLVYNTPIGSISIFGNYYNYPSRNFNYGINIGFLLGNTKLIEQ
ncbi:MAG: patatin-like phospholipase family protein [Bacteroidales bacterium]